MKHLKLFGKYIFGKFSKVQLGIIVVIVVFAFFIGDSNIFSRINDDSKIRDLNKQIDYYHNLSATNKMKLNELKSDKANFEKYARENYLMKKPNEDVFVIQ